MAQLDDFMAIDYDNLALRGDNMAIRATNMAQKLDLLAIDYKSRRNTRNDRHKYHFHSKNYQEHKVRGSR